MKSKLLFLAFFLVVLIFASPPTAEAAAVNLLPNPSFEIDDDGNGEPDDWWLWGSSIPPDDGDSTQEWLTDPTLAYDGNVAVHLRAGSDDADYAMCIPPYIAATPGEVYIFAAFAKDLLPGGVASDDPYVKIEYYSGGVRNDSLTEAYTILIAHDGEYHLIYTEIECPAGIDEILPIIMSGDNSDYMWDSVWFGYGMPAGEGQATQPVPPDGGQALPTLEEFSWTNPEAASPAEPISCDVWFSYYFPEYGHYDNDPNFTLLYAEKILDKQPVSSASLLNLEPPLEMDHTYYWRVDCYDPNKIDTENYLTIGKVWTFNTFNQPPVVDAGKRQKAWLTETSVDIQIDATATDEGMPLDPGKITLKWTVEDGPATPTFDPNNAVEDPLLTFDTVGRYVLRLTANDGELDAYDEVIVDIYPAGYTGLVAHWRLDEESGPTAADSVGGHTGTLLGDPTWMPADGKAAGAILLDGNGDYIEIADSGTIDPNDPTWADELADEITLSIWMKTSDDDFGDDWAGLISRGSNAWRLQRNGNADTVELVIQDAAYVASAVGVKDGKWHHVAGVYNGDEVYIYIDAFLQGETVAEGTPATGSEPVWIGAGFNIDYPNTDYQFNGMLDEARIYEIGLPADRVLAEFVADGGYNSCGQNYKNTDINRDCYVNLLDFAELAAMWLECSDVTEPSCLE